MFPLVILFLCIGLLMIALAIPLILGRVPPNTWYGFRIRLTLSDPEIWYPANRHGGWLLLIVGLVTIAAALLLPLVPGMRGEAYGLWVSAIMVAGVLVCLVLSVRQARVLASERDSTIWRDFCSVGESTGDRDKEGGTRT
jgi:uncharacterized membrane protein